jgi:hypothetical protein
MATEISLEGESLFCIIQLFEARTILAIFIETAIQAAFARQGTSRSIYPDNISSGAEMKPKRNLIFASLSNSRVAPIWESSLSLGYFGPAPFPIWLGEVSASKRGPLQVRLKRGYAGGHFSTISFRYAFLEKLFANAWEAANDSTCGHA